MTRLILRAASIWFLGLAVAICLSMATALIIDPSPEVAFGIGMVFGASIPLWCVAISLDWISRRE